MELGELVNPALVKDPKDPVLFGAVVELGFEGAAKTSLAKSLVKPPHWKYGDKNPGTLSQKPVAYPKGKTGVVVKLKVKITKSENVSGNAKITGSIGPLTFMGDCPTGEGEHDVEAKIDELPDTLVWVHGDVSWGLDVPSIGQCIALNATRIELFTLIAEPLSPFPGHKLGVPVEALRWVFDRGGVGGMKTDKELVAAVTKACHKRPQTKYDTVSGGAHFLKGSNVYDLLTYVSPPTGPAVANCYDQAGAVYLLGRAFGASVEMLYLGYQGITSPNDNFGYINSTALVGVPLCNNPFYDNPSPLYSDPKSGIVIKAYPKPVAPRNYNGNVTTLTAKGARTSFGNHAFCSFSNEVYDACAGPATGLSKKDYVKKAIDSTTDYYGLWGQKPGTASQIGPVATKCPPLLPKDWI